MMFQTLEIRRLYAFTLSNSGGHVSLAGTGGDDHLYIQSGKVYSGPTYQTVLIDLNPLNPKSLTILCDGGNDTVDYSYDLNNGSAPVSIYGQAGNDRLFTSEAVVRLLDGGKGNDDLYDATTINGGDGNDKLTHGMIMNGDNGNDTINGDRGVDSGETFDQTINGGAGNDQINGDGGRDSIDGADGDDSIIAFASRFYPDREEFCTVNSGNGHDKVFLGVAAKVELGAGDDRAYFDAAYQAGSFSVYGQINGGIGRDWIQVKDNISVKSGKQFVLLGEAGYDTIIGSKAADKLYGGSESDLIYGNLGNDSIYGDTGNDTLDGDAGNDLLFGGEGDDSLIGDIGKDSLYGENGVDRLIANDGEKDLLSGGPLGDWYVKDTIDIILD